MGFRFWLGALLLVVLLVAGLVLSGFLTQEQGQLTDLLEQAEAFAHNDNMSAAASCVREAYDLWQKRWQGLAAIADHAPLDEVEATFRQALAFGQALDSEEFAASCARLVSGITAISQAHELSWWNIF